MIDNAEFLIAIANLSIALVAFSTIVVALRQMAGGGLTEFQLLVVKLFSVCGLSALFFSLLPLLIAFFGVAEQYVWRICNPLLGINVIAIHIWYFRNRRIVAPLRKLNAINQINRVIMVVGLFLLLLGTAGVWFDGSIAPYAFALIGLLFAAATGFLRTLTDFLTLPD